MASAARESGGIGGKFPKRPFRRSAPTPYDRPPAAARGSGLRPLASEAQGSGWFSRLVDPASRMISSGASMFLSSMYRKRLTAPPEAPAESPQPSQEAAAADNAITSLEVWEQRERGTENTTETSDNDGISELEQLLKQKTFTRLEFERLTELLRSRTVESDMKEAAVDVAFQEASFSLVKEKSDMPSGSVAIPVGTIMVPEQTIASPSEIAKAYMGSRSSKLPASTLRYGTQVSHQEAVVAGNQLHRTKASDTPIPSRSIENPDDGYFTPKPRGRSAIYKMARTPYFKLQPTTNMMGDDVFSRNRFAGSSTSSQRIAGATTPTGSKQILKRGRSLLDNDLGYISSIRRTRQKSDLASPLKDEHVPSSSIFGQKLLQLHMSERGSVDFDAYKGDTRKSDEPDLHIPVQSSEMARKILQQLDKLVPSPNEKPFEMKRITRDEPSSKLTPNMLHDRALSSMEDINLTKFVGTQGSLDVNIVESSRQFFTQKSDKIQDNGPSKLAVFEAKTSVSDAFLGAARPPVNGMPHNTVLELTPSIPVSFPQKGKPAFIISAPEDDTLELDDDYGRKSTPSPPGKIKPDPKFLGFEVGLEKPSVSSSGSLPAPSVSVRESNEKTSEKPAGILSTVIAAASPAPEPPVPIRHFDKSSQAQERAPLFASGLEGSQPSVSSAISSEAAAAASANNTGAKLNSEPGLLSRNSITAATLSSDLDKGAKHEKSEESLKEFSNSKSLPLFSFGASTSGLSNGSLNSKQPPSLFTEVSRNSDSTVFSENIASLSSPFGFSTSTPPAVSVLPKLQFGAVGSTSASLTQDDNKHAPESTVKNPVNKSFSFANTNSMGTSNLDNSSSSNLVTSSAFASSGGNSNIFSSTAGGSSATASFSGTVGSLTTASAPSFSSASDGIFGSSSLAQRGSSFSSSAAGSPSFVAATESSVSGLSAALSSSGTSSASQGTDLQNLFSSTPSFGLAVSSSNGLGNSTFGSVAPSGIPFGSGSGFSFSAGTTVSSAGASSSSASPASNVFGATPQTAQFNLPSGFGSASSLSVATFGKPATSASGSAFTFGSSAPTFSSQPSFGIATPVGSSSGALSFSTSQPSFGIATPVAGFGSGSPANDQMNVEDSMTDDAQAANSSFPQFGQQAGPVTSSFVFGSSNTTAPIGTPPFQFSGHQSNPAPQNLNPFQSSGGSFSLGSGGVDKANRRFVKVRRGDKVRKK